ncbi:hypothetical protein ACKWTF_001157 [Chironomus riparius]
MKGINIAIFVLLLISSNTDAKGGRGSSGGSRGSSSRGSSSRGSSSGGGWFGSSRSSPSYSSPSYSRPSPSPSYTYSASSPSYTYSRPSPSYTHNSPSSSYGWNTGGSSPSGSSFGSASKPSSTNYGWNVGSNTGGSSSGGSSFGSASKPSSTNYGWNVGSNTGGSSSGGSSFGSASKPSSTNYGWNVGSNTGSTNTGSKPGTNIGWNFNNPSAPVGPPPSYPGMQNRPVPSHNSPPSYSPSFNNPPAYSPSHFNSPSYNSPSYRPSPSYSPSYSSPSYNSRPSPSYGSGSNIPRTNVYGTHSSSPGYYTNSHQNYYGNSFGSQGVPGNTYISNNYYGDQRSGGSGFLTNAMFYGAGMHSGYGWGRSSGYNNYGHNGYYGNSGYGNSYGYSRRQWDEEEDRKWRQTTRAPYFENKVPGEDKILPASAVIGAATAFGLASLLPLNVPSNKPLMYCNNTDLMQSQIQINNEYIYHCINGSIVVSCLKNSDDNLTLNIVKDQIQADLNQTKDIGNQTEVIGNQTGQILTQLNLVEPFFNQTKVLLNTTESKCSGNVVIMECDLSDEEVTGNLYCKKGTLMSKNLIFCNATTLLNGTMIVNGTSINTTTSILNCFEGQVPEKQASFIPTTTQAPVTTTERSLSFGARAHMFFLSIIGKDDIVNQKQKAEDIPQLSDNETWIPEALTLPPETTTESTTTTTTTEAPFEWMMIVKNFQYPNGTFGTTHSPVPKFLFDARVLMNDVLTSMGSTTTIDPNWFKLYKTTTELPIETTESTTTEAPFEWMMAVPKEYENGTYGTTLTPVPKELIEVQDNIRRLLNRMSSESTTSNPLWIKVYKTTESSNVTAIESVSSSTADDESYEWMRRKLQQGSDGIELEPVPEDELKITQMHNYTIPLDWVKVPKNKTMETSTLNP